MIKLLRNLLAKRRAAHAKREEQKRLYPIAHAIVEQSRR
jgi:hypothetical protein